MCIGFPCRIIAQKERWGTVDFGGNRMDVALSLVPGAQVGDWVLVHAGLAIERIDESEAYQVRTLLEELDAYG
jgi:hydrogenase expression/formation protein HypC